MAEAILLDLLLITVAALVGGLVAAVLLTLLLMPLVTTAFQPLVRRLLAERVPTA